MCLLAFGLVLGNGDGEEGAGVHFGEFVDRVPEFLLEVADTVFGVGVRSD